MSDHLLSITLVGSACLRYSKEGGQLTVISMHSGVGSFSYTIWSRISVAIPNGPFFDSLYPSCPLTPCVGRTLKNKTLVTMMCTLLVKLLIPGLEQQATFIQFIKRSMWRDLRSSFVHSPIANVKHDNKSWGPHGRNLDRKWSVHTVTGEVTWHAKMDRYLGSTVLCAKR